MTNKVRSIKTPNFLAKNITLVIISGVLILFLVFNYQPQNIGVVIFFLFLLFIFLSHFLSLITFLILYKSQVRVWYLKHDSYTKIHKKTTYLVFTAVVLLILSYIGQLNKVTLGVTILIIPAFYYFFEVKN